MENSRKSILSDGEIEGIINQLPPEAVEALAALGRSLLARSGGKAKSERKASAARENGKKGGRPRKNSDSQA